MKMKAISALALVAIVYPSASEAQRKTVRPTRKIVVVQKAEPAVCKTMMADYENASKKLAYSDAQDTNDDSAARSTVRETQNGNVINQARMTMDLMKSNGCTLPTFVPSASRYGVASIGCAAAMEKVSAQEAIDRLDNRYVNYPRPVECDTSKWSPNGS